MDVLVAIPAYRCAPQIGRVLAGFSPELLATVREVLVVDNHSPDDTVAQALAARDAIGSPKIRVVRNHRNVGLGGTHKSAISYGLRQGFTHLVILHGDDQALASDLPRVLDPARARPNLAAVLGSRFMAGSQRSGYSLARTWGNMGLNLVFSAVMLRRIRDLGSGLNCFRLQDLADQTFLTWPDGMTFNTHLLFHYADRKLPIAFVPIHWREFDQVSNARNFDVAWRMLKGLARWRLGQAPTITPVPEGYGFTEVTAA